MFANIQSKRECKNETYLLFLKVFYKPPYNDFAQLILKYYS